MIMSWSLCHCCGHSATRRVVYYQHRGWTVGPLYPDVCDKCWEDLRDLVAQNTISHTQLELDEHQLPVVNALYEEIMRRHKQFDTEYEITGFTPIIAPKGKS